ncbi:MAG: serine/threonine-protein kinase [Myxococcota bacterium]
MADEDSPLESPGSGATVADDSLFGEAQHRVDSVEAARVRGAVEAAMFGGSSASSPATLGRFSVQERVGSGGMGMVYSAWDPELDRKVAIKVVRSDQAGPDAMSRLIEEARSLAKLRHPNVVTIYDVGESGGRVWLAMEFVSNTVQAWLEGKPSASEILDVFEQAGRGLIAAHQAQLVHRDFKPSNLLLAESGRAIVADFGLARSLEHIDQGATGRAGTPYFMSPEQFDGRAIDARSDQFSFCVCLYDSLFGEHPFEGKSVLERQIAALEGRIRRPARRHGAPGGVLAVLARGLEHDPRRRFADMEALLDALIDKPRRRRRRFVATSLVGGGILAGGVASWGMAPEPPDPCADAPEAFAEAWNSNREDEVMTAFDATELPYASAASKTVVAGLDAYADAWTRMRVDACEATFVRGVQSERLLDRRMACLDDRRTRAAALIELLAGADAQTVKTSVKAVQRLPPVEPCDDPTVESAYPTLPDDADLASKVQAVESELAAVQALLSVDRSAEALGRVESVLARAEATRWAPLRQKALLVDGTAAMRSGKFTRALRNLEQSLWLAEAQGNDAAVVRAASALLVALSDEDPTSASVTTWFQLGQAVHERLGKRADLGIMLWKSYGAVLLRNQDLDAAEAALQRAVELAEDSLPSGHVRHAELAMQLGSVALAQGRPDRGLALFSQALPILEGAVGSHHPLVGGLHNNFGAVYFGNHEYEKARTEFALAVAIEEALSGEDSVTLADTLYNLAIVDDRLGDPDAAKRTFLRVKDMYVRQHGPEHPYVAAVHEELGILARNRGDLDAARKALELALQIKTQALGETHPEIANALKGLAYVEQTAGNLDRALELFERSATLIVAAVGEDHERSASARARVAKVKHRLGRFAEARRDAAQALETFAAMGERAEPGVVADARFTLAMATWERDGSQGVQLAEQALAESVPGILREEIEAWLKDHNAHGGR